ncbi:hypothetical protein NGRA_1210 [Nosema granulosis]|uniref:Uncharacterized protein n=1 Tax=Nosema granulosis TaxID=83296 RepID=A0A9P6KZT1_9MICR|nr:hypothetical protein NGRA_1210 [Nosema granulosis]
MLEHDYMRRHNEAFRCIHLQLCLNYGFSRARKRRNHSLQEYVSNDREEIRVDSLIQIKHNKSDIVVLDKVKKKILIVEVGITCFDHLRSVEVEKKHKYDPLAKHYGALYG